MDGGGSLFALTAPTLQPLALLAPRTLSAISGDDEMLWLEVATQRERTLAKGEAAQRAAIAAAVAAAVASPPLSRAAARLQLPSSVRAFPVRKGAVIASYPGAVGIPPVL